MRNKIFFILFMIFWISLIILNFFHEKETFSEQENKVLASFPAFSFDKLLSGKYQSELDEYINDHFIFRNIWLKINSSAEIATNKTYINGVYIGLDGYLFEEITFNEKHLNNIDIISDKINEFASIQTIPTYFSIIPNSIYINQDKLPNYADTINQKDVINNIYSKLDYTTNIDTVSTLETASNISDDNQLYFKTDHHMTSDGMYLVYLEICKTMNISPILEKDFTKEVLLTDFLGTFDSKAQIVNQETDTITIYSHEQNTTLEEVIYDNETSNIIYNSDFLETKDQYSYFLNGNNSKVVIKTNVNNGAKLLLIKDSYSHILAQFLTQHFEEIHFIDLRYYKYSMSEYVVNNNITSTLILYNFSNIITDVNLRLLR